MSTTRWVLLVSSLLVVPIAFAVGTPAGTVISNTAFVDYNDANGNPLTRVTSLPVTTTVSQVAGVTMAPDAESLAESNGNSVVYDFSIDNTGNGDDTFSFTYTSAGDWTPTSVNFYEDVNGDGLLDAGDVLIGTGTGPFTTDTVAADGSYDVLMEVTIPDAGTAPNGTSSALTVTSTSTFDGGVTDSGVYTTTVAAAVISGTKSFSATPNPPEPGTVVTYTIVLENTGTVAGSTVVVNDPIPTGMTYVTGSITIDDGAGSIVDGPKTDGSGDDEADFGVSNANAVTTTLGDIDPGGTVTVTFQASVDADVAAGTSIVNVANIDYSDGGTPISETTNGSSFNVAEVAGITVTPDATTATGDPGDEISYVIDITNDGNENDVIDLTTTSSAGLTYALWFDANGDGIAGNGGDFLLTDTDGDGVVDTGLLAPGDTASIIAVATVPVGTADGTTDTLVLTATSSNDPATSATSGNLVATVTAPLLSILKEVSPTGDQPPGTELTYTVTVTNTGSGTATSVLITDAVPTFTTYKAGSILTGGSLATLAARTDTADGDGGTYIAGSDTVTAGNAATSLGAGGQLILQFTATID